MELRERILEVITTEERPLSIDQLTKKLELSDTTEFKELIRTLNTLEEEALVARTRSNKYGTLAQIGQVAGKISVHQRGFGFVSPEDGSAGDIFLPAPELGNVYNGDRVLVKVFAESNGGDRREGKLLKILSRGPADFVGTFVSPKGRIESIAYIEPDDSKLTFLPVVADEDTLGAVDGHKVLARITKYPDGRYAGTAKVLQIIGHKNDPGVDILSIVHKHGINVDFSDAAIAEANNIPDQIDEKDLVGRVDLRKELTVTIDGADAKDLDDAVHVKKLSNGNYELGVHIADVSHYVKEDSPLDEEARERGTSVYLVDRVIPMIPHRLSNGICSLNPHVDRLTLSCIMEIDQNGAVINQEILQSVIKTTERMTYTDVRKIIEREDEEVIAKYQDLVANFDQMAELAAILRERRSRRGAINFDFPEAKVLVNEEGKTSDIILRERSVAEKLIEEFMLAANETVAEYVQHQKLPFMYRIHDEPKAERLDTFFKFIANFGINVERKGESVTPKTLQTILNAVEGEPEEAVVSTVMLRSLQQAKYDVEPIGHFGLSTDFYTHFTSPIRRYPDLMVHRLLREYIIFNDKSQKTQDRYSAILPEIADHASKRERRAVDAERETNALKKAEYMEQHIGETFEGVVSGVTNFGMFVELPNTIEGLVHIQAMTDDFYRYDEANYQLMGERTKQQFRIGDVVEIKVTGVNIDEKTIDFAVVGMPERQPKKRFESKTIRSTGGRPGPKRDEKKDDRRGGKSKRPGKPNEQSKGKGFAGKDKKDKPPFHKAVSNKKRKRP
ncbi:ribonuclease R [Exiguobacterium antarcticum]|uniref:Ribonuclease R n=1 Tax=Exiguobacterium antarcticum TaxID=132920 RepID=A0ABT6QZM6_9BACL|nr:ribonuclease R [Exiguobacterium antarcticum]MDI3233531.1 ribonuclease R [Exiguobacterium antarcticum]